MQYSALNDLGKYRFCVHTRSFGQRHQLAILEAIDAAPCINLHGRTASKKLPLTVAGLATAFPPWLDDIIVHVVSRRIVVLFA